MIVEKFASLSAIFVAVATLSSVVFNIAFSLSFDGGEMLFFMTVSDYINSTVILMLFALPIATSYAVIIMLLNSSVPVSALIETSRIKANRAIKRNGAFRVKTYKEVLGKELFSLVSTIVLGTIVIFPAELFIGAVIYIMHRIPSSLGDTRFFLIESLWLPAVIFIATGIVVAQNENSGKRATYRRAFLFEILLFVLLLTSVAFGISQAQTKKETKELLVACTEKGAEENVTLARALERGVLLWSHRLNKPIFLTWREVNRLEPGGTAKDCRRSIVPDRRLQAIGATRLVAVTPG